MNITKKINNLSENFRKYIMFIKINGEYFYMITGDDLSDKINDKILINKENKIIVSENFNHLIKYTKALKVFDNLNFRKWLKNIIPLYKTKPDYKYGIYNLDMLVKDFILNTENTLIKLPEKNCKEYIDFINLVDSYAEQTNYTTLLKLRRDKNINILWEYFYDLFVWKKPLKEKQKKYSLKYFNINLFTITFSKIYSHFLSNIKIV